tara:strand:+ start:30853 stop:31947 length:1095 start_codon:yes stop_codon:yes gene_type:complete
MKYLISRTDAIGDTLLTTPMANKIKKDIPDAQVGMIVSSRSSDIIGMVKGIDRFWVLNPNDNFIKKLKVCFSILKEFRPDIFLYVGGSHVPAFCSFWKRIKLRGGLVSKWQTFLFLNKGIRQSRSIVSMHESDYNFNLLKPFGHNYHMDERDSLAPKFFLNEKDKEASLSNFYSQLTANGLTLNKPVIMLHPGMTGHTLNWNSRNYGRLIVRLNALYPGKFNYVVSYTPSDESYLVGMKDFLEMNKTRDLSQSVYFFDGSMEGLRNYVHVLSNVELFIGPSTGTTHLANILGINQVAIYSPIKVQSALRWGPYTKSEKLKLHIPDVVCGENFHCAGQECPYYECMAKIEVEDIVKSCQNYLDQY